MAEAHPKPDGIISARAVRVSRCECCGQVSVWALDENEIPFAAMTMDAAGALILADDIRAKAVNQ